MGEAASDRAPVADRRVADPGQRLGEERASLPDERVALGRPLPRERADVQPAVLLADAVEPGQAGEVDERGRRRQAQVEQRAEALTARERLGLAAVARQQLDGLSEALRAVVVERRRLQPIVPSSKLALSWNGSTFSPPISSSRSIES
jgi:hypothetical protein